MFSAKAEQAESSMDSITKTDNSFFMGKPPVYNHFRPGSRSRRLPILHGKLKITLKKTADRSETGTKICGKRSQELLSGREI